MTLRHSLTALLLLAPAIAHAQTNNFEIHLSGKQIGKATYNLSPTKQGFKLIDAFRYATLGLEGQYTGEYRLDSNYAFLEAGAENIANSAHYSFTLNKPQTELTIAVSQVGAQSSEIVDIAPNFLMLPDYDPGAAQIVLLHCVTHPTADNKYNVLIPQTGDGGGGRGRGAAPPAAGAPAGDVLPPGNHTYQALWAKGRDVTGMLDGKPLPLHTYLLAFGSFRWIFFADEQNRLMQLNVTRTHASYIRTSFKLDPIKAPDAK